ncbi:MAG: DUF1127 domain-containing protein [Pseudomonadota bacterium]
MQFHSPESIERIHGLNTPNKRSIWARFSAALKAWAKRSVERDKIMREFDELMAMPDYMLRDIGLTRQQVADERRKFLLTGIIPNRY